MKIKYRPEIDGLRAIAVLSVLLYHFNVGGLLTGGYLGVDVFFVISGFLISSIILKELDETNSFSFINFYRRRIRRLMPVFFVVLISSIIAGWLILLPSQMLSFSKSAIASIFFYSNFHWHTESLVYEAQSSLFEPLLHTWTLSIEEQFYFIFPGLLFLLYKFKRNYLLTIVLILTGLSLLSSEFYHSINKSANFYLLPTRFWELSAGSLLSIVLHKGIQYNFTNRITKFIPTFSFLVLLVCFLVFNHDIKHPSLITAIPVIATMLMIFYSNAQDPVTKILSTKPFIKIGLLSYSLYLWHFPVFAFGRNLNPNLGAVDYFGWIGITFVLSILSNKLIENPFRRPSKINARIFNVVLGSSLLVSLVALGSIISNDGYPNRTKNVAQAHLGNEIDNNRLKEVRDSKFALLISKPPIKKTKRKKVLILGDSHSRDLYLSFKLNEKQFSNYVFDHLSFDYENKPDGVVTKNKKIKRSDIIILAYRFNKKKYLLKTIGRLVNLLKIENKRTILSLNNAEFSSFGRNEVFDQYINEFSPTIDELDVNHMYSYFYENRDSTINEVNNAILKIAKEYSVEYIDRYNLVCSDEYKKCLCVTDSLRKVYTDTNHLSLEGAKFIGKKLRSQNYLYKSSFISDTITFDYSAELDDPVGNLSKSNREEYDRLFRAKRQLNSKLRNSKLPEDDVNFLVAKRKILKNKIHKLLRKNKKK